MSSVLRDVSACLLGSAVLFLVACGGDTSVRFCTGGLSCAAFGNLNRPPSADAGADQQGTAGDLVRLDGSASTDGAGRIASYAWVQTAGIPVALVDADRAEARFIAPDVDAEETLRFELTVTDDNRASDRDSTTVRVFPAAMIALEAGIELLEKRVYPRQLDGLPRCRLDPPNLQDEPAFVGLWLVARVTAVERDPDDVVISILLDELRRLLPRTMMLDSARWDASLYRLGVTASIRFAEQRDPALAAELADALAMLPIADEDISALLVGGRLGVFRGADGVLRAHERNPASLARSAVRLLIDSTCHEGVDAPLVAAATVVLLAEVARTR